MIKWGCGFLLRFFVYGVSPYLATLQGLDTWGIHSATVANFLIDPMPLIISLIVAALVVIARWQYLLGGTIPCSNYPSDIRNCKHVHGMLCSLSLDNKSVQRKSDHEFVSNGNYRSYLRTIKLLVHNSTRAVQMTLPKNPYDQINDDEAFGEFKDALQIVRRRPTFGADNKVKHIMLTGATLSNLRRKFAEDLVFQGGVQMNDYIHRHYGTKVLPWWLNRLWNSITVHLNAVDLRWSVYQEDSIQEFLRINQEMDIFYGGANGRATSEIVLDFKQDESFESAGSVRSRKFFRDQVLKDTFYSYCAEYELLQQENPPCLPDDRDSWVCNNRNALSERITKIAAENQQKWYKKALALVRRW